MNEQSRSYRQIRSAVLAEVAHLEWKQAVTVLASALNERAVEGGFRCKALIGNEDYTRYICDQCIKGITALLKVNPGRKHLRYLPKRNKK